MKTVYPVVSHFNQACVFRRERETRACVCVCASVCLGEREHVCVCVHSQYVYILMQKAVSEKFNSGFL